MPTCEWREDAMDLDELKVNIDKLQKDIKMAIEQGDIEKAGKNIFENFLGDVKKTINTIQDNTEKKVKVEVVEPKPKPTLRKMNSVKFNEKQRQRTFASKGIGRISGMLMKGFGFLGNMAFGLSTTILVIIGVTTGNMNELILPISILAPFLGISMITYGRGKFLVNRYKRYEKYLQIIGNRHFIELHDIVTLSDLPYKFVLRDLKKMIQAGMLPQASVNEDGNMLFLSRGGYEQYQYLMKQEQAQLEEHERKKVEASKGSHKVVQAGREYLQRMCDLRIKLRDQEAVVKIIHMEAVLTKIVEFIEKRPEHMDEVRRLMDYYLPTTIKLLGAYYEFEQQPVRGENIVTAQKDIKETLDMINHAFEKLLDQMFKDLAWDVSTDISVLETMLAQEGLTKSDIEI